jgi:hypothetical protein
MSIKSSIYLTRHIFTRKLRGCITVATESGSDYYVSRSAAQTFNSQHLKMLHILNKKTLVILFESLNSFATSA